MKRSFSVSELQFKCWEMQHDQVGYICIYTYTLAACALSAHVAVGDVLDEGGCGGMGGGLASRLARAHALCWPHDRGGGGFLKISRGHFL